MANHSEQLENDPLFLGITRPAMIYGVSFEFAVINGFFAAIVFLAVGKPWYLLVAVPGHMLGYLMCMSEPRRFGIVFTWLNTMSKCRNRMFWGGSTYTPH